MTELEPGTRVNGGNEKSAGNSQEAEPTDHQPKYKPDEDQLAQHIARKWRDKVSFFQNYYRLYQDGIWKGIPLQRVQKGIRKELRCFRAHGVRVTHSLVTGVGRLLEGDLFIEDEVINAQASERAGYLNFSNGLLRIEVRGQQVEREFVPHRPDLYFTTQLPFAYDQDAECPNFMRFLRTSLVDPQTGKTDEKMVALTLQAIFYSMTGRTDFRVSFWLVGASGSGKSTLLAILRRMMGDLFTTLDLNQLNNDKYILVPIVGRRLVAFSEASVGSAIPDALYKALVGGEDEVMVFVKYKDAFAYKNEAKLWWAMNEAPRNLDRSGALANRIKPILFPVSIPQAQQDRELVEKCAQELPGIFNACLPWGIRLFREGRFIEPEASRQWLEKYRLENDTENTFLEMCCIRDPEGIVPSTKLYSRYRDFCRESGFREKNLNQVAKDWERLGLIKIKRSDANYWKGVQFKDF